jgi:zinc D-Ala-D-Ala carboxypeptidase
MNLSEHFTLAEATYSETAIRHGINNQPSDAQLQNMKSAAAQLEAVRALVGAIRVNSWLRLPAVNIAVGGAAKSSHMDGWAIDCSSKTHTPFELCQKVLEAGIKFDQLIHEYGSWMHISFAPEMRQQTLTVFKPFNQKGMYQKGILTEAQYRAA